MRRVAQFAEVGPVWLTRAATFAEKAALFPGAAFVLGWDTAVRVIDPKYYGGKAESRLRSPNADRFGLSLRGRRTAR